MKYRALRADCEISFLKKKKKKSDNIKITKIGVHLKIVLEVYTMNVKPLCNQSGVSCRKLKFCPAICGLAHKHNKCIADRFFCFV